MQFKVSFIEKLICLKISPFSHFYLPIIYLKEWKEGESHNVASTEAGMQE